LRTEEVDWGHGNDPQTLFYVPVTADEALGLAAQDLSERELLDRIYACCDGRRFLVSDWPRDAPEPEVTWSRGHFKLRHG
jgi:hypothetical protein